MSDSKISNLTAATTPLVGTEVLPIVQSGTTKKVSVADLTVGRDVSAASVDGTRLTILGGGGGNLYVDLLGGGNNYYSAGTHVFKSASNAFDLAQLDNTGYRIHNGNLIIGTAGNGIDFSADNPDLIGMTSELLDDYEEGAFTPSLGGSTTYSAQVGRYTKVGNVCHFSIHLGITSIGTGSTTAISGLPFTALYNSANGVHAVYYETVATLITSLIGYVGTTNLTLVSATIASDAVGANPIFKNGTDVRVEGWYFC